MLNAAGVTEIVEDLVVIEDIEIHFAHHSYQIELKNIHRIPIYPSPPHPQVLDVRLHPVYSWLRCAICA